jgi:hypothetical protein
MKAPAVSRGISNGNRVLARQDRAPALKVMATRRNAFSWVLKDAFVEVSGTPDVEHGKNNTVELHAGLDCEEQRAMG